MRSVDPEEIRALKAQPGGDMAVGGANLAAAFAEHDLIDEYRLLLHPLILGAGRTLFEEFTRPAELGLTEQRLYDNGVLLLRYARA